MSDRALEHFTNDEYEADLQKQGQRGIMSNKTKHNDFLKENSENIRQALRHFKCCRKRD